VKRATEAIYKDLVRTKNPLRRPDQQSGCKGEGCCASPSPAAKAA
jgi:hypothetical protein